MQPPPAPPLANLSVWQRTVPGAPFVSSAAPAETDLLVVGGGLCGATIAHSLLTSDQNLTVTLLEARALASGASGRNAGHCRPDPSRGFTSFEKHHGAAQALKVLESESEVLRRMDSFIKQHDISCEWTLRTTYDASLSEEFTAYSAAAEASMRAAGGSPAMQRLDGKAAEDATRVKGVSTAWAWDAATINPAQLTVAVHKLCADTGRYTVCENSPVLSVEKEERKWRVTTDKGGILASKVVWANNAYVASQCEELEGIVVPIRAQAHKLSAASLPLDASYSLRKSLSLFYSVAPRPDGSIILGVSRGHLPTAETGNRVDDNTFHPALAHAALASWRDCMGGAWGVPSLSELEALANQVSVRSDDKSPAAALQRSDAPWPTSAPGFEYAWSGIIGCTPDLVPLVGDRPGSEGQYLAVGYNGHGMARIFVTAPALAKYVLTGEWDAAMPECFRSTPERMAHLRAGVDAGVLKCA